MSPPAERSPRRGFTLIEIMVVVAIIGILAAVIIGGLGAMRTRADLHNTLGLLSADIQAARWMSAQRSCPVVIVLDANHDKAAVAHAIYEETGTKSIDLDDLSTFPPPSGDGINRLELRVSEGGVYLADKKVLGVEKHFPFPFRSAYDAMDTDALGCSFCRSYGTGVQRGGMRFLPDGRLFFSAPGTDPEPDQLGGAILFAGQRGEKEQNQNAALVILSPSGLTRIFTE